MVPTAGRTTEDHGRERDGVVAYRHEAHSRAAWTHTPARLYQLYEIGKVLTRIDRIETAMHEILALVSATMSLRDAILLYEHPHGPRRTRTLLWHAEGVSTARLHAARTHAYAAFEYLAGSSAANSTDEEDAGLLPGARSEPDDPEQPANRGFVLLPLVLDRDHVFGVLQVDGVARLDETDLMFLDAVVGQLAIALDRHVVRQARQADAENRRLAAEATARAALRAEQAQRMLSETSERLANAPDERTAHAIVARAAIPYLADLCVLDAVAGSDGGEPVEVVVADPAMTPLVDRVRALVPAGLAMESDRSRLFADLTATDCMMIVPMIARGRMLGALTFVSVSSRRRYDLDDLALAEDLARRAALAIDNLRLYAQAQHAVRARDDLLAIVSHDLKNPLNNIVLCAMSLRRVVPPGDTTGLRRVEAIELSTRRMNRIINDLLDLASIAAGRMVVDLRTERVSALVVDAVESHEASAGHDRVRLDHDWIDRMLEVDCDRGRVLQIFGNLLGNAIKFTPAGGAVVLGAKVSGPDILFSVSDNGPGIAPDELPHVFDRYWQARRTAHLGNGLGLAIAKALVEAHGGRIWVESVLGHGTTFFFTIPQCAAAAR